LASEAFLSSRFLLFFIALGISFIGINKTLIFIIHMSEKTSIPMMIAFIVAGINVGINFLFLPVMGIMAAALSTFIAYAVQLALSLYFVRMLFSQKLLFWPPIWKLILSSVPLIAMLYLPAPANIWAFSTYMLLGIGSYIIGLLLLKGIGRKEFELVINLIEPIKRTVFSSRP
jgi:O-antigen/teichoic acid export membrane protein